MRVLNCPQVERPARASRYALHMGKEPHQGEKVRSARQARGLSVADLAKRAGVDPVTIYRLESGERKPRAATLSKIIKTLAKLPKLPEI